MMAAAHHQQASSSGLSFEVFLSFHGKDVRTSFADHLYHALVRVGIRTFKDTEELRKGEEIGPNLLAAIQQSIISVPILSMNYAYSKWCLNELQEIVECRRTGNQMVLPIFYKIEPRDVRNQTREYAEAFDKEHPKHFSEATIQKWRDVLQEIGKLDGWHFEEGMLEGELVKEVVKRVSSTLNKRLVHVSNKLVGIKSHMEEMLRLLDVESEVTKIVGIHGLGGIGKTTIASAVYNTILEKFEDHAFIENIREDARKFGIHYLQNKLIAAILKDGSPNIFDVDTGKKVIQQRLCTKRVLVVLDDLDEDIQAESLVGDGEWFGVGSRIIITSRDKDILIAQKTGFYEPDMMNFKDSLELFSNYAFKRDHPQENYLDISKAIVKTTGGLPLALKIIGSSLFSKKKPIWESMLKKLQKIPNNDVMERLKISYDCLEYEEQQMFLDTACFFIGMKKGIVCHIWEGSDFYPEAGLDVLCTKSLIMISEHGELRMHDILQDLGKDIIRRESAMFGERSRIWSQEEVLDVLINQKGRNKCIGLMIDFQHLRDDLRGKLRDGYLMSKGLDELTDLRLLQVDHAQFLGISTNSFSELRYLSWKGCPDQYALTNFCPRKLAVLDLSGGQITEYWIGWKQTKMAVNLKILKLKSCKNLVRLSSSIGYLDKLVMLDLSHCEILEELPNEICKLTCLETLNLRKCSRLAKLPMKMDRMISLTTLDICGCDLIEVLPDLPPSLTCLDLLFCESLQQMSVLSSGLNQLEISYCSSLKNISGLPSGLTKLQVSRCYRLQHIICFPSGSPSSLTSLCVEDCRGLEELSGLPSSLASLEVRSCQSMVRLSCSASASGLRNLKKLHLSGCKILKQVEGLDEKSMDSLEELQIWFCELFRNFHNLLRSKNLRIINLKEVHALSEIDGERSRMESLEKLKIKDCGSLSKIRNLQNAKRLRNLQIKDCPKLTEIQGLEGLPSLAKLSIDRARSLESLTDLCILKNLRYLFIRFCNSMRRLPHLSSLKELRELEVVGCQGLFEIPGLDGLQSFQKLEIRGCEFIQKFPNLSNLKNLKQLRIEDCRNIVEIHGFDRLDTLRKLDIIGCWSLRRLPDLSNLKSLTYLRIKLCKNLSGIHGVDRLEVLYCLDIYGLESLERLPDLSNLKNLAHLRIEGCKNLMQIRGVDRLKSSLHTMSIRDCGFSVPDLSNLKNFNCLSMESCKYLSENHGIGIDRLKNLEGLKVIKCCSSEESVHLDFVCIRDCKDLASTSYTGDSDGEYDCRAEYDDWGIC